MPKFNLLSKATGLALVGTLALLGQASADMTQKGFEVAARSDRSDRGFADSLVDMQMVLTNAAGQVTERNLELRTFEIPDEQKGDLSMIVFSDPADIEGTALLSHARILDPDDQWLYLPALKRVKRISSVNKSGPFVGSEFAFEDFTSQELNKFTYTWLREEACGEFMCDVVERVPAYEHSGYVRQVSWTDQSHYQTRRVEFFDRGNEHLKTLVMEDYKLYEDFIWRPHLMRMENHKTGKKTDLVYGAYAFKTGLTPKDFQKGVLKRLR
ncbi:MAG: outer membrane lipoprotein-sorting protein [Magnetovibrionaceae bacterium]